MSPSRMAGAFRTPRRAAGIALAALAVVVAAVLLAVTLIGDDERSFRYGDPFDPFPGGGARGNAAQVSDAPDLRRELRDFLPFVVSDVQRFWQSRFERAGVRYVPAQVVVFSGGLPSPCGVASTRTGPFYCTLDRRIYLDLGFFRQLAVEFRAPGDFAQAYVIAHEVAHHVQNLTGVTRQVQAAAERGLEPPNELSIRQELQADCLAGVWGHSTYERGIAERGDVQEGIRAAEAVGDDRIQAKTTGRIDPETWTHGSSDQRVRWFVRGFRSGDPNSCDTFSDGI